jgi:hypothetical protein
MGQVGRPDGRAQLARTPQVERGDAGDTLLEVLFALVILSIATVALLVAFATSISASATHRGAASFDTAIRDASQLAIAQIQQQTSPLYESCPPSASWYEPGGGGAPSFASLPTGFHAQVTGMQWWNGSSFTSSPSSCVTNSPQWITITITELSNGQTYTDNFIVEDPNAPPVPAVGPAYQLVFAVEPAGAIAGQPFTTQPVIRVEDAAGNLVTSDLSPVTLSITPGTGTTGANLSQYCVGTEVAGVVSFNNCNIGTAGLAYQLNATDPGLISAISTSFNVYIQLDTPVITSATPSTTTAGAISVSFTGSSNAPTGENYTATACANSGVGFGCVTQNNFTSGSQITGLTPGTSYVVTVTANAPTPLYLPATSAPAGPVVATTQLNPPGTPTLAYGTAPGSVSVTFTTPTPAAPGQAYTATACTNAAMTSGCVSGVVAPGGNLTGLAYSGGSPGSTYYVKVLANASSGYLASSSSGVSAPHAAVSQVNTPTNLSVAPSSTTAGAIAVTFSASAGPTLPSSYTATICTNAAMTTQCTAQAITPGTTQVTGLSQGTTYYVEITANSPSAAYLPATTAVSSGALATTQLTVPTGVTLGYGTSAGSVNVAFSAPSDASSTQTYTVKVCTNAAMTTGCVSNANFTPGNDYGGLNYTQGSAGPTYYVTITANASPGYFASPATSVASHADTSKLDAPGTPSSVTSTTTGNAIVTTFAGSLGTAPASYTATACTNSSMTSGCVSGAITSGGTLSGLVGGQSYYVAITANPPAGYVSATSSTSGSSTVASTQLNTPVINSALPSTTTVGAITINYSGSSNAPGGQLYTATACTDAAMTQNCVSHTSYVSGAQFGGLTAGTSYYATITAVTNGFYIGSTSAVYGPVLATSQLSTPSTPTLAFGSAPGTITVSTTLAGAPVGQLYTVKACTNVGMTTGCVTTTNVLSGGNAIGLSYTTGSPGTTYYVTVTAQASAGYLGSGPSGAGGPHAATSQVFAPGAPTAASSTTTAGAITATFTNSAGPTVGSYTATACTNSSMTQNCVVQTGYTSGAQLTGLSPDTSYYVQITANSTSAAYASNTSSTSSSALATTQLAMPTINAVASSTTTAGAITISYTNSSNAPGGQTYTAKACTNSGMTTSCVTNANYTSGAQLTGLIQGTSYYVTITANASVGYLAITTASTGPAMATVQLATPSTPVLAYGTVPGSIAVTTSSSNAPAGQLYTINACPFPFAFGCTTDTNVLSGGNATGLSYSAGSAGSSYYVTATAQASPGYLASAASNYGGPQNATSQLNAPTNLTVAASTTTAGAITATFTASTGTAPASYTAIACTDAAMTQNCVTHANYTSGAQLIGLTVGTGYYVTITAVSSSAAYVSATTSAAGPATATTQLAAPTSVSLAYGTVPGSIAVTFSGSSNAPGGQTYTAKACTNVAMTTGCVTNANYTSGTNLTGLSYAKGSAGTSYYVTVTANASSGYLASAASSVAGPQNATSQLNAPTNLTVAASTTTAGAITATFTASTGTAPASYTAIACTNAGMTTGCLTQANYTSGAQLTGLTSGTGYYVTITAVSASAAYASTTTAAAGPATATTQLAAPTITSVVPSASTAGALVVNFTGSSNAPGGQTYTAKACTNVAMTTGCVTNANYTSGAQLTGLSAGTGYYVTITANASSDYLAATSGVVGPTSSTIQLAAPTSVSLAYGAVPGSIAVTFSGSSNALGGQTYTAKACTNVGMTTGCVTNANYTSGTNLTGLSYAQGSAGTAYYVTVTANASSGYLASAASGVAGPQNATSQLNAPTNLTVAASTTTAGAITATFTASTGTAPASYTAIACTDAAMTQNCVTHANYTSGAQLTGLTAGTGYYVTITAVSSSAVYVSATTSAAGPAPATTQLASPTSVSLGYGTVAGSIAVTFTGSPGGQTYTAKACTNVGMTTGCVTNSNYTSGTNLTGLSYAQGSAGTSYFVTVTANASSGYLASAASSVAGPQNATSQVNAPGTPTVATSTTTAGAITATFTASTGTAPASYTAIACTNAAMTTGCVTQTGYTSGAQLTGLTQGSSYYVTITAVPPAGYVSATSAVSASPAPATTQLASPTSVSLGYGTVAGSIAVTFTGSPGGQTYTAKACTNVGMTTGCVTNSNYTSGTNLTGLSYAQGSAGTSYFVTVTANASSGYLASAASSVAGPQNATSQVNAPGTPTVATSTTTAGAITATFTASTGTAPASYTAIACTNAAMTTGCVTQTGYTSGAQLTGLTQGSSYYVTITAVPPAGYVSATSAVSASPAPATTQLASPTITSVVPSGSTTGALVVNFTSSSNAPGGQTYTAKACTNVGMTTGCVTNANYTSGAQLTGLSAGTGYYLTITANASSGYLAATSTANGPTLTTVQLAAPTISAVAPSTTTAGALTITFTGSSNAPGGQSYTATACTNVGMTTSCVTKTGYTSGAQLTGLTAGTNYYVTITAGASAGYLATTTAAFGPTMATVQLGAPSTPVLAYGTAAGSITVTTATTGAPAGQLFTIKACTNAGMTNGCVTDANELSGANATGLVYVLGSAGTAYYVTASAQASSGYLASGASSVAGPQAATSQLNVPTGFTTASSTTTAGAITATFTASTGTAPASYTAAICTNAGMTTGCTTQANYASGAQITGLTPGTGYYVTITANPSSAAYLSATTASSGPTLATTQLTTPTGVSLAYGTAAGSISVTFTGSSNAAGAQAYTAKACTNVGMTTGCVTNANYTSGANLTGLVYTPGSAGTTYYVTVTANASAGYLVSAATTAAGPQAATSQLNAPTSLSTASSATTAGAITATFTASTGTAPASYTAAICTNAAMTAGCTTQANFTSGTQITGLTAGTDYYVTITANSSSAAYASATTASQGPTLATVQLALPTGVSLAYGSVAGSIAVTYTGSSNAAGGQTYTAKACTNVLMTTNCVTNANITSGANLTGLTYAAGSAGTSYYVTVTANASTGYLVSAPTAATGPQADTSQLNAPTSVTAAGSGINGIKVTFTASTGAAPSSYTAIVCTNVGMTTGCVTTTNYTSGSTIGGLSFFTTYYAEITAISGSAAYLPATSSPPSSARS